MDKSPPLSEVVPLRPALPGVTPGDAALIKAHSSVALQNCAIGPRAVKALLRFVEPYWKQHGKYPPVEVLMDHFELTAERAKQLNSNIFYLKNLDERGINRPDANVSYLTERQVACLAIMTNIYDRRPIDGRMREAGITSEEIQGWMSNPEFQRRLSDWANQAFDNTLPVAQTNLARLVERGNLNAIKYYMDLTGASQSPEAVNAKRLTQALVAAVQRHVKDPAVLKAIADEVTSIAGIQSAVS